MAFQRGDVVLLPFPFSDLTTTKTRPAVVVSSDLYHDNRPDLLVAYVSSQLSQLREPTDHLLADWQAAGLLRPSFVRAKIATIEPTLVVHAVGTLSATDLEMVDQKLRSALGLTSPPLIDLIREMDFTEQSPAVVQTVAEQAVKAVTLFAQDDEMSVDLAHLRQLL